MTSVVVSKRSRYPFPTRDGGRIEVLETELL
jgi:hypothetical protein